MDDHLEENLEDDYPPPMVEMARPAIFEGSFHEGVPAGFDTVTLYLDGGVQADLNWKNVREDARAAIDQGFSLMWDIELALFNQLKQPLTNQGQFLSLALSLEHFRDSLWKEFKESTVGISFYRGKADFSLGFLWDLHQEQNFRSWLKENCGLEELEQEGGELLIRLFCRDVAVEYLLLLASRLPDTLPAYLYLDVSHFNGTLADEMQLLNPERFDRFHLALKEGRLPFDGLGWGSPTSFGLSGEKFNQLPDSVDVKVGVCVPPMNFNRAFHYQGFEEALAELQRLSIQYNLIAENVLTSRWDGLDYLLYSPAGLSSEGKRKLQGFCAAGGTTVSTGNLIGLPQELTLRSWFSEGR